MDPKNPIYLSGSREQKAVYLVARVSVFLALLTVGAVVFALTHRQYAQGAIAFLAACWAILPPIWFFYEYFWLYRAAADPDSFELFKHGQHTAIAIWAGISLTLGGLATSDLVKPKEATLICTPLADQGDTSGRLICHQVKID